MSSNPTPFRSSAALAALPENTERVVPASGPVLFVPAASRERATVRDRLARMGVAITTVVNITDALRLLGSRGFALCLVDLADDRTALPSLRVLRTQFPQVPVAAIVDPSNPLVAGEALNLGAVDLLPWPFEARDLATVLANAADRHELRATSDPGDPPDARNTLVAHSAPMRLVVDAVRRAAEAPGGVCLCGESGTGRQRIARAIHALSARSQGAFVSIDCSGAGPQDLERRLFGLPAERKSAGLKAPAAERIGEDAAILQACGGTLYLANVVDAPARVQARLARLLRDREAFVIEKRQTVDLDVRLMASAEAGLDARVADGHLRDDLYERLLELRIDVPPLGRRREDIPVLAVDFLRRACAHAGVPAKNLSRAALALLSALPWPGNGRDLASLVETLVHSVTAAVIQLEDVLAHATLDGASARVDTGLTLRDARARFEHDCISAVLIKHHGRVGEAAKALGIQRTNLYRKVRQLNVARSLLAARR
ncbi:MAG: sigma-54-dependent transcriptional regulator [Vicinamibacterales bacterium]